MVTIDEQRALVQQARTQLESQKNQVTEEEEKVKEQISQAKSRIPSATSQRALRSKFTGLQGRNQRNILAQAGENISKEEQRIKGEIEGARSQLASQEEQIASAEGQIAEYDAEQQAYRTAQTFYNSGNFYDVRTMPPRVQKYLREMITQGDFEAQQKAKIESINQGLSTIEKEFTPFQIKQMETAGIIKPVETTMTRVDTTTRVQEGFLKPALEINPATGREYGVLSAVETPSSRLDRFQAYIQQKRGEAKTQELRGEGNFKTGATLFFGGIGSSLVGSSQFARNFVNSPFQTTKSILVGGKEAFKKAFITGEGFPMVSAMILEEPQYLTGYAVAEVAQARAGGAITALAKEKIITASTRLSPKYSVFDEGIKLKSGVEIKEAGGLKNLRTPLTEQAKIAGQTINAVSAQRDLFGLIDDTKIVRKPIPNEASLTSETKELLKQFDEGKLQASKISELNKRIIAETGSKGLLERSFFADPYGRIRVSRLGVLDNTQKKASMLDVLSGDVTTKKSKPQIILFENVRVADFPKSLSDVKKALLEGKSLTPSQQNRLLEWQLKSESAKTLKQKVPIEYDYLLGETKDSYISGLASYDSVTGKEKIVINKLKRPDYIKSLNRKELLFHEGTHILNADTKKSVLSGWLDFEGKRLIKQLPKTDQLSVKYLYPNYQRGAEARARLAQKNPSELIRLNKNSVDILQYEGQFKPIGFISQEPEVIISPNTLIKKQNTPAVTLINNKRVEVITAEIISTPDKIQKLLNKKNSVGLTSAENAKLANLLESSTGLSYVQSESPYFDIGSKTIGAGISVLSNSKTSSKPIETISYNVLGISQTSSKPSIEVYNKPSYKVSGLGSPNISPVPESPKKYDLSFDFKKPKEYKEPISPPPRTPTYSPPVIKPPRIKPPIKEREERFFNAKQKIKEIASEMFSVFKRTKGKDVFVGKAPTEYSAFEKLKRELRKDTSASGFVEQAGKGRVKVSGFADFNFRVGKSDPFKLVQRRGGKEGGAGRLSTRSEVYDIFRQNKRNKKPDWFS